MLMLQCDGCKTVAFAACSCAEGVTVALGGHHPDCQVSDLDSLVACPPESGCCKEDHHHGQAANACPATHDEPCAQETGGCTVCRSITITVMPGSTGVQLVGTGG